MHSKDHKVAAFLKDLAMLGGENSTIIELCRSIYFSIHPNATERMMYGGIMFSLDKDIGGIFAYKKHVSLEFSDGYLLNDPDNILQGSGKLRRHLKLQTVDDTKKKKVSFFVHQLAQL